jgi:hypothetical protein
MQPTTIVPPDQIRSEGMTYSITILKQVDRIAEDVRHALQEEEGTNRRIAILDIEDMVCMLGIMVDYQTEEFIDEIMANAHLALLNETDPISQRKYLIHILKTLKKIVSRFFLLGIIPPIEVHEYELGSPEDEERERKDTARDFLRKFLDKNGKAGYEELLIEIKKEDELDAKLATLTIADVINPAYLVKREPKK